VLHVTDTHNARFSHRVRFESAPSADIDRRERIGREHGLSCYPFNQARPAPVGLVVSEAATR